jgi:hypothetical protein
MSIHCNSSQFATPGLRLACDNYTLTVLAANSGILVRIEERIMRLALIAAMFIFVASEQSIAAQVIRHFSISASDFGAGAPLTTIKGDFTLIYEVGANFDATSSGLTYSGLSAPHDAPVKFAVGQFGNGDESIQIGTDVYPFAHGVSADFDGFGFGLINTPTGTYVNAASYSFDGAFYIAQSFSLTAVPEPATWAMILFGFGSVGYALRRKQAAFVPSRISF